MLNAPLNSVFDDAADGGDGELIQPGSPVRIALVGAIFVLLAVIISVRISWVQTRLTHRYLEVLQATTTEVETLPARDGRILADTVVLAADKEQYALQIHYRWLQEPPDPGWLKLQIRRHLTSSERKRPELVAEVEARILAERRQLRENLIQSGSVSQDSLETRRNEIQERVTRIAESVNARREQHLAGKGDNLSSNDSESRRDEPSVLIRLISAARHALTTAPSRPESERIIVREEESWHTVAENLPLETAAMISEHPERFPGAKVVSTTVRTYPEHRLAAHIVGARTDDTAENSRTARRDSSKSPNNSDERHEVTEPQRHGRSGVELSCDERLRGISGIRHIVRNRRQQVVASQIIRKPQSGRDVVLTIDVPLQKICEQLLAEALTDRPRQLLQSSDAAEKAEADSVDSDDNASTDQPSDVRVRPVPVGGSIVVMDPGTGRLLAAASAPDFDLAMFTERSAQDWKAVNADRRRPFITRFTGMALPPGSTFKTLTAIAALETGTVNGDTPFFCQGFLQQPDQHRCLIFRQSGQGHHEITLSEAIAQSCNVYFFDAAGRMGFPTLKLWTDRLGFGQPTGIDLPYEKSGTVPGMNSAGRSQHPGEQRRLEREALGLAIGQSRLTVTPLQMARLMAAVVNGGWLVTPHVVSDEGTAHRSTDAIPVRPTMQRRRVEGLSEDALVQIRKGLVATVEDARGTGYRTARLAEAAFGGKTGTAETGPGKADHAWFAGFAPADDPKYVFVVVLEHGGSGSHAAGPVAREIVRYLMRAESDAVVSAQ